MLIISLFFCALLILSSFGLGKTIKNPLSREVTSSVNGFFLITVFLSHFMQYCNSYPLSTFDQIHPARYLGQLIVVMFLFYSGYGIMESIRNKPDYMTGFIQKRILPTYLDFWVAIILYFVIYIFYQGIPTFKFTLYGFLGWESFGNSNWYIFVILGLYFCSFLSFRFTKNRWLGLILIWGLSFILLVLLKHYKANYWISTIFAYPFGMTFSEVYHKWFSKKTTTKLWKKILLLGGITVLFCLVYPIRYKSVLVFELLSILFALVWVVFTHLWKTYSPLYSWIGKNLFPFYIYQRIPMIVLAPLARESIYLYFLTCIAGTLLLCRLMIPAHAKLHQLYNQYILRANHTN